MSCPPVRVATLAERTAALLADIQHCANDAKGRAVCPACANRPRFPHDDDCELVALIREHEAAR